MRTSYNPPRKENQDTGNPIEIDLVYNVRSCGTCNFFWPENIADQPYGPYPTFDFTSNFPDGKDPQKGATDYFWLKALTNEETFPNGEVMDGCRKAPIMTIGINPNLTAFAPGLQGTSWAYPNFTSNDGTDAWKKYAYYYRYRSVFQEHLNLDLVKKYLLTDGQIVAPKNGILKAAIRTSADPNYTIQVQYDGDETDTTIQLNRALGSPRYVLLYDHFAPTNRFMAGDVIAAKLDIPAGVEADVFQQTIGYYEQFVPPLSLFTKFLQSKESTAPDLQVGEDVCQLDMVACASPHWGDPYLGNQEKLIIQNCVSKNAWAIKQLVQTKPAILFLVGEATSNMFLGAFGNLLVRNKPLSSRPEDGAFTLFRETTDINDPCYLKFDTVIDGTSFSIATQIVITPHFSYNINFVPQFRMNENTWESFQTNYPDCAQFLQNDKRIQVVKGDEEKKQFAAIILNEDPSGVIDNLKTQFNAAYQTLVPYFYDAHQGMANAMINLYNEGKISYTQPANGSPGYLTRTESSCHFCDNSLWKFPQACPYGKTKESPPPAGFLQKVAAQMVTQGKKQPEKI